MPRPSTHSWSIAAHHGESELLFEVARPGSFQLEARAEPSIRVTASREFTDDLEGVVGPDRVRFRAKSVDKG